ncbi:MAG: hypothetical protein KF813_09760 [Trueperaceae bacterium]|nr:hypothetical protein [Trueperaceae bacterium]
MLPDEARTSSCGSVVVIAKSGADRFLARCTCGCLHLVWDNASISLLESDLFKLIANPPQADRAVDKRFEMRADPFGGYQVWAGSGGLRVPQAEWSEMLSLLEHGAATSGNGVAAAGTLRAVTTTHQAEVN